MHLSQERYGDALVLAPIGRVDNSTTDGLKSGLDAYVASCRAGGNRLVLDFSKVDYISSVGLRVLMLAGKEIREQGGSIVVAALQPVVREIFEISRFNLVFQCFGSVREALTTTQPMAPDRWRYGSRSGERAVPSPSLWTPRRSGTSLPMR
ncbi:MAG: STAS domain-containing protein [Betaproteobacteria bacterium]|nr:MAG: STAS domain-containing protein [Betaproteobacteria bacterium]